MIQRMALRAATIKALTNNGTAPFPTMAFNGIFDTKLTPIEHALADSQMPIIIVCTDVDRHMIPNSGGQGRGFNKRSIKLLLELAVGTFQKLLSQDEDGNDVDLYEFNPVQEDFEMEAILDLLEWQVWRRLSDPYAETARDFHKLVVDMPEWTSAPARKADQANPIAMRLIEIDCTVNPDCIPRAVPTAPGQTYTKPDPGKYLDIPWLADLDAAILANPSFAEMREQLREAITGVPSTTIPIFTGMSVKTDAINPEVDPARLPPDATEIKGPDGRIEYQQEVEFPEATE